MAARSPTVSEGKKVEKLMLSNKKLLLQRRQFKIELSQCEPVLVDRNVFTGKQVAAYVLKF